MSAAPLDGREAHVGPPQGGLGLGVVAVAKLGSSPLLGGAGPVGVDLAA